MLVIDLGGSSEASIKEGPGEEGRGAEEGGGVYLCSQNIGRTPY